MGEFVCTRYTKLDDTHFRATSRWEWALAAVPGATPWRPPRERRRTEESRPLLS